MQKLGSFKHVFLFAACLFPLVSFCLFILNPIDIPLNDEWRLINTFVLNGFDYSLQELWQDKGGQRWASYKLLFISSLNFGFHPLPFFLSGSLVPLLIFALYLKCSRVSENGEVGPITPVSLLIIYLLICPSIFHYLAHPLISTRTLERFIVFTLGGVLLLFSQERQLAKAMSISILISFFALLLGAPS